MSTTHLSPGAPAVLVPLPPGGHNVVIPGYGQRWIPSAWILSSMSLQLFSQTKESVRNALGSDRFRADWDARWGIPIEDAVAAARAVFAETGCYP